jgi:hypothetical protein
MAALNRSLALALSIPLAAQLGIACATTSHGLAPGETPAEITLPPTNTLGNIDQIRRDLRRFSVGTRYSHTRPGKCETVVVGKTCSVDVDIQAIGLTTDIVPLTGPARFRIIGRAKNNDPRDTEDAYSLKPGVEYLIWVAPAKLNRAETSRTQWGILELPAGSTGPILRTTFGYVLRCPHEMRPGFRRSDTDFKDCDDADPKRTGLRASSITFPGFSGPSDGAPARLFYTGALWFDCGGYCCTGTKLLQ